MGSLPFSHVPQHSYSQCCDFGGAGKQGSVLCLTRSASVGFLSEIVLHTRPGAFYFSWDEFPPLHQQLAEAAGAFLQEPALQRALSSSLPAFHTDSLCKHKFPLDESLDPRCQQPVWQMWRPA